MSRGAMRVRNYAVSLVWGALACGGGQAPPKAPPPPVDKVVSGPPEPELVESNKDCIRAEGICDGGMCTIEVHNECEAPVACELAVLALCKGGTTAGEARGKARDTLPVGAKLKMEAMGNCEGAMILATQVEALNCR